jgi:type II secretory pathway component GspD/PulD (secretin)
MICGSVLLGNVALGPNSWLPFEEGAKVVTLRNTVGQAAGEPFVVDHSIVDVTVGVKVEIAFSHDTAAQYKPAVSTIEQCFATVQDALDAMAPFFPRRPESGL